MSDEENSMDVEQGAAMSQSDGESDSSVDDSKHDEMTQKALGLEKKIAEDIFNYSNHIELIQLYSQLGELDQLRAARKRMAEHFPLSAELWMNWLRDEIKLISTPEDKKKVIELFDRAVQDYLSVEIWQEYQTFSIGCLESHGLEWVRNVLERGVNAGGIHASQGVLLWETYRELENCILASVQASNPDPQSEPLQDQQKRVASLFKRQLSCPLLDMERTYAEFQSWLSTVGNESDRLVDVKAVDFGYKLALSKVSKILTFEESLLRAESNSRLPIYESYLQYERNAKEGGNNPTRVQCLYERALADVPLTDSLWVSYIGYLTEFIRAEEPVLRVLERAVRNCPWVTKLWLLYLTRMEGFSKPLSEITAILERALCAGLAAVHEYVDIWAAYISSVRRVYDATVKNHAADSEEVVAVIEKFRTLMDRCYAHTLGQYGIEIDPHVILLRLWAHFEASRTRDLEKMRLVWNQALADYGSDKSALWCLYAAMEKKYGDAKHLRKLYTRALTSTQDYPEAIAREWLDFELQDGSLESLEVATDRVDKRLKEVHKKREMEAKKEKETGGEKGKKGKKKKETPTSVVHNHLDSNLNKRKMGANSSPPPTKVSKFATAAVTTTVIRKPKARAAQALVSSDHEMEVSATSEESKKSEAELLKERGVVEQHDSSKDDRTVFLSNMDYSVGEDVIRQTFTPAGSIEEIRIVKNFKGLSKGFAFVVFSKQSEAQTALAMDRVKIDKRPLFISECNPEKTSRKHGLKYSVGVLEKTKLFVKGLPYTTTEEDLRAIFSKYGELKDVRIVVLRNGKSKGIAYVEFKDDKAASNALISTDNMTIGDKTISVAISKPPERNTTASLSSDFSRSISLGAGGVVASNSTRVKSKTQLSFLPRSVLKPTVAPAKPSVNNNDSPVPENKPTSMKSNNDFRDFLLGKK